MSIHGEPDDIVRCRQCDWPVLRDQEWVWVEGRCPACDEVHLVGVVHSRVCALALSLGEDRVTTQRRRAGVMGYN